MPQSISIKEYFADAGSAFTKKDAEVIGPQLEALAEQGLTTEHDLVTVARSANSPLHPYFDWNDKSAAAKFRLGQAKTMIRSISVRVVADGKRQVVPAYSIVRTPRPDKPAQAQRFAALHGEALFAAKMSSAAFADLVAWKAKYSSYIDVWKDFSQAFSHVVDDIKDCADLALEGRSERTENAVVGLQEWRAAHAPVVEEWIKVSEEAEGMLETIDNAIAIFNRAVKAKERKCMRCSKPFMSEGIGNRLCVACSSSGSSYDFS